MIKESRIEQLKGSANRALLGNTPVNLYAFSVGFDEKDHIIFLKAHFLNDPSEEDLEDIYVVDTEIMVDFLDNFETKMEIEVVSRAGLHKLAGGFVYLKSND